MSNELSFWERDSWFPDAEVVIIGAGIVGLTAAITLLEQQPDLRVLILERGTLPQGASTKNAGFACFGSPSELLDDLENGHSEHQVMELVARRWNGLQRLRSLLGDTALRYEPCGSYEVFGPDDEHTYQRCLQALPWLNHSLSRITNLPNTYTTADHQLHPQGLRSARHLIHNSAEGALHSGFMMQALLQRAQQLGATIAWSSTVHAIEESTNSVHLYLSHDITLKANQLLHCSNAFITHLLPGFSQHLQPARNQVLCTTPIPNLKLHGCFHYQQGYFYFRHIGQRVLIGGGRHLDRTTETTDRHGTTPVIQQALHHLLTNMILPPNTPWQVEHSWSGILAVGPQKTPLIQRISPRSVVAVRCGGMGVAMGALTGEQAAQLVLSQQ